MEPFQSCQEKFSMEETTKENSFIVRTRPPNPEEEDFEIEKEFNQGQGMDLYEEFLSLPKGFELDKQREELYAANSWNVDRCSYELNASESKLYLRHTDNSNFRTPSPKSSKSKKCRSCNLASDLCKHKKFKKHEHCSFKERAVRLQDLS